MTKISETEKKQLKKIMKKVGQAGGESTLKKYKRKHFRDLANKRWGNKKQVDNNNKK